MSFDNVREMCYNCTRVQTHHRRSNNSRIASF